MGKAGVDDGTCVVASIIDQGFGVANASGTHTGVIVMWECGREIADGVGNCCAAGSVVRTCCGSGAVSLGAGVLGARVASEVIRSARVGMAVRVGKVAVGGGKYSERGFGVINVCCVGITVKSSLTLSLGPDVPGVRVKRVASAGTSVVLVDTGITAGVLVG